MGFGKDGKGAIVMESRSQALGALAANAGILIGTKLALTEDFRMLKSRLHCNIFNHTPQEGGGLCLYLADGDLSLAEAEAKIDGLNGPLSRHDRVGTEVSMRFVKLVGAVGDGANASSEAVILDSVTGAPVVETKPRWTFGQTTSWNWIIYNHGEVLTTGATAKVVAENFGVWIE